MPFSETANVHMFWNVNYIVGCAAFVALKGALILLGSLENYGNIWHLFPNSGLPHPSPLLGSHLIQISFG